MSLEHIVRDAVYAGALCAMSPVLLYKFARGKYRAGWREKLGFVPERLPANRVWIHAVSVGETVAAAVLAEHLRECLPEYEIVASTTTPTGQEVARKRFGHANAFYLPLDFSGCVRRAVARTKPSILVLAETEIWPNLVATAAGSAVPVVIVNGRISDRAFPNYERLTRFFGRTMRRIAVCAVQTEAYAARFRALGVPAGRIVITGSLKYDGITTEADAETRRWARSELQIAGADRVLLGGSTHPTEEVMLARAWRSIAGEAPWRLVITPRHPERTREVAAELQGEGFAIVRRTEMKAGTSAGIDARTVILVDTVGELGRLYHAADLVFVGGSLVPHGGQNPVEPAGIGKATIFGPHMANFQETVDVLLAAGGARQLASARELSEVVGALASDERQRERLGDAARGAIRSRQGAAARTAHLISNVLAGVSSYGHNAAFRL